MRGTAFAELFLIILGLTIVFLIIALPLAFRSRRRTDQRKKIYAMVVSGVTSIDKIAAMTQMDFGTTISELEKIIDLGNNPQYEVQERWQAFTGAYIDYSRKRIVLADNDANVHGTQVVICNGCGAENTIVVGRATKCKYCGTPLQ